MSGAVYSLRIPAPVKILNANSEKDKARSRNHRAWRDGTYAKAVDAKLPTGLELIRVDLLIRFNTASSRRNETNYHPSVGKPCVDALGPGRRYTITKGPRKGQIVVERGYGMIADDTSPPLHCPDCPHIRFSEFTGVDPRWPLGLVTLTITDLSAGGGV